jgi:hypothetical protein
MQSAKFLQMSRYANALHIPPSRYDRPCPVCAYALTLGRGLTFYPSYPNKVHSTRIDNQATPGTIVWANTCAFGSQPVTTLGTAANPTAQHRFGTLGRLQQFGSLQALINFSAAKTVPNYERLKLEFRGELFKAFNQPNFGLPSSMLNRSSFGLITSTEPASASLPCNV